MNATASGCLVRPVEEPLYGQGENCFGKAEVVGVGKLRVSFLGKQQQKLPPMHPIARRLLHLGPWTVSPFFDRKNYMFEAKMRFWSLLGPSPGVPVPLLTRATQSSCPTGCVC